MKRLRNKGEDLAAMLKELKVGDEPIFDAVSNYEITRTPGGYIYKNEYCGLCFVPEDKTAVPVVKAAPKKTVTK